MVRKSIIRIFKCTVMLVNAFMRPFMLDGACIEISIIDNALTTVFMLDQTFTGTLHSIVRYMTGSNWIGRSHESKRNLCDIYRPVKKRIHQLKHIISF